MVSPVAENAEAKAASDHSDDDNSEHINDRLKDLNLWELKTDDGSDRKVLWTMVDCPPHVEKVLDATANLEGGGLKTRVASMDATTATLNVGVRRPI